MSNPPSLLVLVEQAIARGETLAWICANLNVTRRTVLRVRARMDAAVAEDIPQMMGIPTKGLNRPPLKPCGTHAAFVRHHNRSETPCGACRDAEREYQRRAYEQRKRVA